MKYLVLNQANFGLRNAIEEYYIMNMLVAKVNHLKITKIFCSDENR